MFQTKSNFISIGEELKRILCLSISFLFLFASDYAMTNMQKVVVSSIADDNPNFNVEGYTLTGLCYTMICVGVWVGPYFTHILGPRLTMFLSAVGIWFYCSSHALEEVWALYVAMVISGLAYGALWPAHGHYMIENSLPKNTARNVSIFWFIYMSSNFFGNALVLYTFQGKKYINQYTRRCTIFILVVVNTVALVLFANLPKSMRNEVKDFGLKKSFQNSLALLISPEILWLLVSFCYVGLQQAYWMGIYSPSIGFTLAFGNSAKEFVALSGIFMSLGALTGAFFTFLFSSYFSKNRFTRRLTVMLGSFAGQFSFFLSFLNLPNTAVFGNTDDLSFIRPPSVILALIGSFLVSLGDSLLATQLYSFLGEHYRHTSAEASALYTFFRCASVAVSFFWCGHLGLHTQLAVLTLMSFLGVFGFWMADRKIKPRCTQENGQIESISGNYVN